MLSSQLLKGMLQQLVIVVNVIGGNKSFNRKERQGRNETQGYSNIPLRTSRSLRLKKIVLCRYC
jgi:hypothetical protein